MTEEEIRQKLAVEAEEAIEIKDSPSNISEIEESQIISEIYDPDDNRYSSKVSERDFHKNTENTFVDENEEEEEEEEADYCGIKNIDLMNVNNKFSTGNYEKQWNIFQSSAVTVAPGVSDNSKVSSSNEYDPWISVKTETSEEEFDDFGRKKIKDVQLTKKVVVTHLMAWNNSPILIELLKHVFKHRNFEKELSFDISKVLAGRRGSFRQEGAHEKAALELLEACFSGPENQIFKLISKQNLDVDVADSRGNTGLLLAAAKDRLGIIDTLLNLGANVDSINDECLTPLSMCVLRLLEVIHGVTNWSKAFLPKRTCDGPIADDEHMAVKNFEQWHSRVSYESLVQQLPKQMDWNPSPIENGLQFDSRDFPREGESKTDKDGMDIVSNKVTKSKKQVERVVTQTREQNPDAGDNNETNGTQAQKYIFDMSPILGTFNLRNKFKNDKTKNKNNQKTTTDKKLKDRNTFMRSKELPKDSKQIQDTIKSEVSEKKEKICATISKLLERGADPNFTQMPYPVLIMAIFTKIPSLVSELLEHGANPDTTLDKTDHYLTPLMILAVLQPAYEHSLMAKDLLMAEADPSKRTDPEYRPDLMERFKQSRSSTFLDDSEGMTALHLLAIRPDIDTDSNEYLGELIKVIYQHGCVKSTDLYQGHSPLSLAIFEGNLTAAKAFLKTSRVNVNEQLGTDLGNAMLMLGSCRLQELLPPDLLRKFLELLLEYGGCPFASARVLDEEYNQIEYGRKELIKMSEPPEKKVKKVEEKRKKNTSKESKSSKISQAINFATSMKFVENTAKEKLIERVKANFVKDLMDPLITLLSTQKQSELIKKPIFENAMTWMTGEDVAIVMKAMNYNRSYVRELVRLFVTACILRQEKNSPEMDTLIRNETERIINEVLPLVDQNKHIVKSADFGVAGNVSNGDTKKFDQTSLCRTESNLDDNRFKVCFECLTVHGKILILCPKCERVYFCSQECNVKSSARVENLHQCPIFYQKEWIILEKIARAIGPENRAENYILGSYANPELYKEDYKTTGLYKEPRGGRSVKNQDDNTVASIPKCNDQDFTTKKYEANQTGDESDDQNDYKEVVTHGTKDKRLKNSRQTTGGDDSNIRSTNRHNNDSTYDTKDKKAAASSKKSNREKGGNSMMDEVDLGDGIKSKHTNKKGRGFNDENNQKDAFNNIESKKGIKKVVEANFGDKIKLKKSMKGDEFEQNRANGIKIKKGNKKGSEFHDKEDYNDSKFKSSKGNRSQGNKSGKILSNFPKNNKDNGKGDEFQQNRANGIKIKKGNKKGSEFHDKEDYNDSKFKSSKGNRSQGNKSGKILSNFPKNNKDNKKGDEFEQNRANGIKIKKGNKKGSEFDDKEDYNDSKLKSSKGNRSQGKRSGTKLSNFPKNNKDNEKDGPQRKHEARQNKQEWEYGLDEKLGKGDSNDPNKKSGNRKSLVETNVPEKYLDWLLKVSRSAGEHLDIDMLLLPYVVFAQGDTYFRILPANQYPKFIGNYSLI